MPRDCLMPEWPSRNVDIFTNPLFIALKVASNALLAEGYHLKLAAPQLSLEAFPTDLVLRRSKASNANSATSTSARVSSVDDLAIDSRRSSASTAARYTASTEEDDGFDPDSLLEDEYIYDTFHLWRRPATWEKCTSKVCKTWSLSVLQFREWIRFKEEVSGSSPMPPEPHRNTAIYSHPCFVALKKALIDLRIAGWAIPRIYPKTPIANASSNNYAAALPPFALTLGPYATEDYDMPQGPNAPFLPMLLSGSPYAASFADPDALPSPSPCKRVRSLITSSPLVSSDLTHSDPQPMMHRGASPSPSSSDVATLSSADAPIALEDTPLKPSRKKTKLSDEFGKEDRSHGLLFQPYAAAYEHPRVSALKRTSSSLPSRIKSSSPAPRRLSAVMKQEEATCSSQIEIMSSGVTATSLSSGNLRSLLPVPLARATSDASGTSSDTMPLRQIAFAPVYSVPYSSSAANLVLPAPSSSGSRLLIENVDGSQRSFSTPQRASSLDNFSFRSNHPASSSDAHGVPPQVDPQLRTLLQEARAAPAPIYRPQSPLPTFAYKRTANTSLELLPALLSRSDSFHGLAPKSTHFIDPRAAENENPQQLRSSATSS